MAIPTQSSSITSDDLAVHRVGLLPMLLEVLALCGYGLWVLLGLAMALGIYTTGRGDALVPLTLGFLFVSAGLVLAFLARPWVPEWHGWQLGRSLRPTREALIAMATYLPMLGLAGMVRGNEQFWATRLISVALVVCSVACLITSAYGHRARRMALAGVAMQIPLSRVLSACYGGGWWLWVCVIFQGDLHGANAEPLPWAIALLMLALLLGLADGLGWQQSLRMPTPGERVRRAEDVQARRFLAAILICAMPCLSLLIVPGVPWGRWISLGAAIAYVAGKTLELQLYDVVITRPIEPNSG